MVDSESVLTPEFIYPVWPVPDNIKAVATTRIGGFSKAPLNSFNLGLHVNDDPVLVNVIAIMTADCLPVLFASRCGGVIGGAHAGWRGLADGVIEKTVKALPVESSELIAWLGPAIGPQRFEVGAEVRERFINQNQSSDKHFVLNDSKKYLADLYGLAKDRLMAAGVESIHGGGFCTHTESNRFFSHRRDQGLTGRMAALIWKV